MQILHIAGYKFISIRDKEALRKILLDLSTDLGLKGTILLSEEGINISLSGTSETISSFLVSLKADPRFSDMTFHETYTDTHPFQYLKVKLKNEIITLRKPEVDAVAKRAPSISPTVFKQWLDEKRDITLLDTRNDYEVRFGTFTNAVNLQLADFGELPAAIDTLNHDKPIVMFCTGGIRCEKAALYLLNNGYSAVYQLDGGILGYFANVGGEHYEGDCFVFDERISVDCTLQPTATVQCKNCQGPVTKLQQQSPAYIPGESCPACKC